MERKQHRRLFVFVDDTELSRKTWKWVQSHTVRSGDHVTLVTVAVADIPLLCSGGIGGPAALEVELEAIEAAKKEAKIKAHKMLDALQKNTEVEDYTLDNIVLTAHGMGVAEAVVEFLKKYKADEVVVGSRNMGAFKKSMMTLIGKGSVSDYVVHNAPCTVVVVRRPDFQDAS